MLNSNTETEPKDMELCVYCGHSEFNSETGAYLECRRCGMITEQAELTALNSALTAERLQSDRDPQGAGAAEVYADEEETLDSAWRLMQSHAWDKALDALVPGLYRHSIPWSSPLGAASCWKACSFTAKHPAAAYS